MKMFRNPFKSRDKPKNEGKYRISGDNADSSIFFSSETASGAHVSEQTSMRLTAVYACVRILSETVAGLPLHLYRYTNDGKEKAISHSLYYLLHDEPNPEMSSFTFRETLMSHLLLYGNAYAQILRNGRGEVTALYPLLPHKTGVYRADSGEIFYTYSKSASDSVTLPSCDVLHVVGLGYDGLVGYSPIQMAKNAIGLGLSTEEFGSKFFANGARPGGVIEHPAVVKDPAKLRESWNAVYQGSSNSHRIAVLEEGARYNAIGISPNEAQFLETRRFQLNEIARIFRVPPHMIGDLEKSSFSNIEQQSLEFVKYSLDPWVVRWEQAIQRQLLSADEKKEYFVKFNVDGLLRGDYATRMTGYATARQNGWMSSNDIRSLENMNRIPAELGGDLFVINGAMTKLEDAGIFADTKTNETEEKM